MEFMELCYARDEVLWLLWHNDNLPQQTSKRKSHEDLATANSLSCDFTWKNGGCWLGNIAKLCNDITSNFLFLYNSYFSFISQRTVYQVFALKFSFCKYTMWHKFLYELCWISFTISSGTNDFIKLCVFQFAQSQSHVTYYRTFVL